MAQVNIALELFGIGVTLPLLLCSIMDRDQEVQQKTLFTMMLAVNALVLVCDIMTWAFENQPRCTVLLYICNSLVYSLGYVMTWLFSEYLTRYISRKKQIPAWIMPMIRILCIIAVALVAVSVGNHMFFSFDDGIYVRGPLYWLSQVYPIFIMLLDMAVVLYYRRQLGLHDTLSLLSYGALPVIAMLIQIKVYGITLLYLASTLSMVIIYTMIYAQQGKHLREQQLEVSRAKTSIMLSQIQPHFVFNVLCVIQDLCHGKAPEAEQATVEFSEFLRANLESISATKPISFQQELKHVKNYLSLEKKRFGSRLTVEYDIKDTAFRLPPLTIQPIVENAVRYGIMQKEEGGKIIIRTEKTQTEHIVEIIDNGVGFDVCATKADGRSHIGITNVHDRLRYQCGGTLAIKSVKGMGTVATLKIPKGEKPDENFCG